MWPGYEARTATSLIPRPCGRRIMWPGYEARTATSLIPRPCGRRIMWPGYEARTATCNWQIWTMDVCTYLHTCSQLQDSCNAG